MIKKSVDGSWIYGKLLLAFYDVLVMKLMAFVWRCHSHRFVDFYNQNILDNHADIGVGTGYCLDKCQLHVPARLTLFDLSERCLEHCSRRLSRFDPELIIYDVCVPLKYDGPGFDSIALGGLLHCLPGDLAEKCKAFDHIQPITLPGTKIFGYMLMKRGVNGTVLSNLTCTILNAINVTNLANDNPESLHLELSQRFEDVTVQVTGNMVFFTATVTKGGDSA